MIGTIPESLGNLVDLESLDLSGDDLSGSIPSSFGNLVNLQYLSLRDNLRFIPFVSVPFAGLSGPIPESLGNLTHVQHLLLGANQLSGSLAEMNRAPL